MYTLQMHSLLSYLFHALDVILKQTLLSPVFVTAVVLILVCERYFPVHRSQPTFSLGMLQDSVWVALSIVFEAILVSAYADGLRSLLQNRGSFLIIHPLDAWPVVLRLGIAVLMADFLAWFQHWLKHKVPWFWEFHAVHHSQREINLFTDFRFHLVEYLISRPIVILPLVMLSLKTPTIVYWTVFINWYTRFYHANIKTNLGPLRYLVVTPQSHRVHHSILPQHTDQNFGVLFSIWDSLFKTRYAGCQEYPPTGIVDPSFPLETKKDPFDLLWTPIRQLVYPFVAIVKNLRNSR